MIQDDLNQKLETLKSVITQAGSALVAFSGGVDSSFLLKVCYDTLGGNSGRLLAATARSSTYPRREMNEAIGLARLIGAEHVIIDSEELDIEGFAENPPNRCYHCKSELFRKLAELAGKKGIRAVFDGANADDLADYRPGSRAAEELGVRSPLQEAGLTKDDIRALSKRLGLPTWNKPAFACLASRFPYGARISREKLSMVERVEQALMDLGFPLARARHHGDVCRLELEPADIQKAVDPAVARKIHGAVREAGFLYASVDLLGYRTGSMNEGLDLGAEPETTRPGQP